MHFINFFYIRFAFTRLETMVEAKSATVCIFIPSHEMSPSKWQSTIQRFEILIYYIHDYMGGKEEMRHEWIACREERSGVERQKHGNVIRRIYSKCKLLFQITVKYNLFFDKITIRNLHNVLAWKIRYFCVYFFPLPFLSFRSPQLCSCSAACPFFNKFQSQLVTMGAKAFASIQCSFLSQWNLKSFLFLNWMCRAEQHKHRHMYEFTEGKEREKKKWTNPRIETVIKFDLKKSFFLLPLFATSFVIHKKNKKKVSSFFIKFVFSFFPFEKKEKEEEVNFPFKVSICMRKGTLRRLYNLSF